MKGEEDRNELGDEFVGVLSSWLVVRNRLVMDGI